MNTSYFALLMIVAQLIGTSVYADTYERTDVRFVAASEDLVEVGCETGDQVITGSCYVTNRDIFPNDVSRGIIVESKAQPGKAAWSCQVKILDPRLEVRLISTAKCKKS